MNVYYIECEYTINGVNSIYRNLIFANNSVHAEKLFYEHANKCDWHVISLTMNRALGYSTIIGNVCV